MNVTFQNRTILNRHCKWKGEWRENRRTMEHYAEDAVSSVLDECHGSASHTTKTNSQGLITAILSSKCTALFTAVVIAIPTLHQSLFFTVRLTERIVATVTVTTCVRSTGDVISAVTLVTVDVFLVVVFG